MNPEQARTTIVETFRQKFDDARFLYFVRNLVNHLDESKKQTWTLKKAAFEDFVNHFTRLGTYTDPDGEKMDVLVIHLRKETTLARGRVTLRNFVADYLATGHGQGKAAVIAAFVSPQEDDWRFSFVKLDYTFEKTELGFVAERIHLTPARRYSYLVGKNENCHTAQKQFLALLETHEINPTVAQLEAAFSVEKVTKEFYEHYKELFEKTRDAMAAFLDSAPAIKKHFAERGIECDDFAKKLLGQIVFLYFLQKKGWFGVERGKSWGSGRKDFIRHLFNNRADYAHIPGQRKRPANFFNDILEPLFYEAIAAPRTDDDHYYSRFDCRIPFLNGGLFEPLYGYNWVETEILLPDTLFANNEQTKDDTGTGILDMFDRYNFTVNEAEPLEKEVAVDPEMLGLVFENLLPENIRHSSGTYYTPRVIVHYICQQALLHYLCTRMGVKDDQTLTPALSRPTGEGESSPAQMPSDGRGSKDARIADHAANVSPSPGGEGRGEGGPSTNQSLVTSAATITRADLALFLRLAERFTDFQAKETKKHADKRLPESIRKNAARLDELLATITVCDLAIGSGAFAVGMMHEIVRARMALAAVEGMPEQTFYHLKRHAIQHSLYGVDLDPGAVEIAKLRLWLSMVVDEDNISDIQPLPNLDYKIMQGNSLLEEFDGVRLLDDKLLQPPVAREAEIAEIKARIAAKSQELIRIDAGTKISATRKMQQLAVTQEVNRLKKQLSALVHPDEAKTDGQGELNQQTSWASLKRIQELHEKFFGEDSRTEKDKLRRELDALEWDFMEATLREQGREEAIAELKRASATHRKPFFLWRLHFAEVFQQRGGFDVVIANPPYVVVQGENRDEKLYAAFKRLYEVAAYKIDLYHLFIERGVQLLRNDGAICYITPSNFVSNNFAVDLRNFLLTKTILDRLVFFDEQVFQASVHNLVFAARKGDPAGNQTTFCKATIPETGEFVLKELYKVDQPSLITKQSFLILRENILAEALLSVMDRKCRRLDDFAEVAFGMQLRDRSKFPEDVVENPPTKKALSKFHKPCYTGKDISRYHVRWQNRYCYFNREAKRGGCWNERFHFAKQKILLRQIGFFPEAGIDTEGYPVLNTAFMVVPKCETFSSRYLVAIINSSAIRFYWINRFGDDRKTFPKIKGEYLKLLPIPAATPEKQKAVERLVDRILAAKAQAASADVSAMERELDELVHALYGLTPEEIKLVEGSAK
jgi:methylase of polypeptide subunit release factors